MDSILYRLEKATQGEAYEILEANCVKRGWMGLTVCEDQKGKMYRTRLNDPEDVPLFREELQRCNVPFREAEED